MVSYHLVSSYFIVVLICFFSLLFGETKSYSSQGGNKAFYNELDPNERYFTYIPISGLTNQFLGFSRAMKMAKDLNRTLLLPPIISSKHDDLLGHTPWSLFFDLERFMDETGMKIVEYHNFRNITFLDQPKLEEITCKITFSFHRHHIVEDTVKKFLKQFALNLTLESIPDMDPVTYEELYRALKPSKEEHLVCISTAYKFGSKDPNNAGWYEVGTYLRYQKDFDAYVRRYTAKRMGTSPNELKPYFGVHIRRGDFHGHCNRLVSSKRTTIEQCIPSVELFAKKINEIKELNTSKKDYPVLVTTNEKDIVELMKIKNLGWNMETDYFQVVKDYGIFGPVMVDSVIISNSDVPIGVKPSTFFIYAGKRASSWYGKTPVFM